MTKIKVEKECNVIEWMENIEWSPYYSVAIKILERRGNDNPNIADLFETFQEIAKIDHKINKREK